MRAPTVSHLRSTSTGFWKSLFPGRDQPLLHEAYQKVHVEGTTREDLESLLEPSQAECYLTHREGRELVEFITDADTRKVVAKKYVATSAPPESNVPREMRFETTLRLVRQILTGRKRTRRFPRTADPQYHQPARGTTLYEWFAGPAAEKLLGRGSPQDRYYVNGRPIEFRAYRTLLASRDGGDLLVEVRTRA